MQALAQLPEGDGAAHGYRLQNWTFFLVLLGTALLFWLTLEPIWVPVVLGLVLAVACNPLHHRLRKRVPRAVSAGLLTGGALLLSALVIGLLVSVVGTRVVAFAREATQRYTAGGADALLGPGLTSLLGSIGLDPEVVRKQVADGVAAIAAGLGHLAASLIARFFSGVFVLILTGITCFYLLLQGEDATRWFVDVLPLPDRQVWALVRNVRDAMRALLLGTVVTAFFQGLASLLAYEACSVPDAIVWASLTAVASLIPGAGTALVWGAVTLWELSHGNLVRAAVVLGWNLLVVVGFADYYLRPRLLGSKLRLNDLLIFIAIFGGVEAFGLLGLLLGPLIAAALVSLLGIYQREYRPHLVPGPNWAAIHGQSAATQEKAAMEAAAAPGSPTPNSRP